MKSIWERGVEKPSFPALRGEKKTDVLIIGGGMTGILCAYMLRRAGIDCLLVEAGRICGGVTGCTTAKVTIQHGLLYAQLLHRMGTEVAQRYFCAQQEALERYRTLCQKIDCDFSEQPAYVYSLGDRLKIERETDALNRIGCTAEFVSALALPFDVAGAVRVARQAQMHPLKLAYALAKELPIYENSRVVSLSPACAITEQGSIRAEQIIVATHFPFLNWHGSYFLKLYQHRSYVLVLKHAQEVEGMYVDEAQGGLSFRNAGDCLILGGGGHRTGKKSDGWQGLVDFAGRYYPQAEEICRYATQDCMTLDGMPYIGRYAARTHGLYVATGFNKWGMTACNDLRCRRSRTYHGALARFAQGDARFPPRIQEIRPTQRVDRGKRARYESCQGLFA